MAYIRSLPNGNFRADVRFKGIIKNKTFPSKSLAQDWAEQFESNIELISNLKSPQLLQLSEHEIDEMGGEALFKQLGIDLFSLRHAAKLDAIHALSKKELLQLSAHDIERLGGVELFVESGKRIRYKMIPLH